MNKPANIFDRFFHYIGLRNYWLIGTHVREIKWVDLDNLNEKITFYLFEDTKGKRFYKVHDYGFCEIGEQYKQYLGPIIAWTNGHSLEYLEYCKEYDLKKNEERMKANRKDNIIPFERK